MKLSEILTSLASAGVGSPVDGAPVSADFDVNPVIGSIHYDSREVMPGGLFVAIPGFKVDGHDFVKNAVERGAVAVVAEKSVNIPAAVIPVSNSRKAMAAVSAAFFDHPSEALTVVGITGTNGKTTVTYLVESVLKAAGHRVGVIGTVNYRYPGKTVDSSRTTPESLDLQRILSEMRAAGVTHVVLEVASHGIDLHRIDFIRFDVATFTNLTQDHLDYHGNMDHYWACKQRLFTDFLRKGPKSETATAVINRDDARGKDLYSRLPDPKLSVGRASDCDIRAIRYSSDLKGIAAAISVPGGELDVTTQLVGYHNLENLLCAAGTASALKVPPAVIAEGLTCSQTAPGRLEPVADPSGRFVYVDYAHTPDALENVLNALIAVKRRRLICVFGCGGDRDRRKRPLMGGIATRLSDLTVVTSDNPRSETPMTIIQDILEGIDAPTEAVLSAEDWHHAPQRNGIVIEPDRRGAIRLAILAADPGDIVLIAGKGHETYQIVGDRTLPFDDREEAMAIIQQHLTLSAGRATPR